jgi:hypothetical protein
MNQRNIITIAVVAVLVLLVGWIWVANRPTESAPPPTATTTPTTPATPALPPAPPKQ